MALVVRSMNRNSSPRIVRIGRGATRIGAEAGVRYQLVDDMTGKAPTDAVAHKAGHDLVIRTADGDTITIEHFYDLTGAQSAAFEMPGASLASITPMTDLMQAAGAAAEPAAGADAAAAGGAAGGGAAGTGAAAGAAAAGAGLGSALPIGLGALALGAGAAAAGGGGGGGGGNAGPPPDTTPPVAPTGLDLDAADDTGASNSDNITSQTSALTITGSAEANAKVEILSGATILATVTASATGSFTADVTLPAGVASITARATDAAGNVGAASTALAITVDTTAPAAPTIRLDPADDTGSSNNDNITNQSSGLTITGTAEAGSTVQILDGAAVLGSTTANSNGAYSYDVSLAVGVHSLTARAIDIAGNTGAASGAMGLSVVAAAATPSAPILLPRDDFGVSNSDSITNGRNGLGLVTIYGFTGASQTVNIYDGSTLLGTTTATAAGTYYFDTPQLADGVHSLTARAFGGDGSLSAASAATAITIDRTPNKVYSLILDPADDSGYSNSDGVTNHATGLTLLGTADPNIAVDISFYGTRINEAVFATVTSDANGRFTYEYTGTYSENPPGFPGGIAGFRARAASDIAGNTGAEKLVSVRLDTTLPPKAVVTLPADQDSGYRDNVTVQRDVTFGIYDGAFTTDTKPYILSIYDNGLFVKSIQGDSFYQFGLSLVPGEHNITVTLTDAAGNVGPLSAPVKLIVANTASTGLALDPASDSGISNSDHITNLTVLTFTGNAQPGAQIVLKAATDPSETGSVIGMATVDSNGHYSITASTPGGTNDYYVTGTDTDNLPIAGDFITVTTDRTAPTVPTTPDLSPADDSGVSNLDNITDISTGLTFTGSGPGADMFTIFDNGVAVGTTSSGFTYSFDLALASGTHQISVQGIDKAGNIGAMSGALTVTVNPGHDDVIGTSGNDILVGNSAANGLFGGLGADRMTGGAGADTFYLESARGQTLSLADVITDFQVGTDHMAFDPALVGSGPALTFADLTIAQGTGTHSADTIVSVTAGGSILAVLENVTATTVTAASFTF